MKICEKNKIRIKNQQSATKEYINNIYYLSHGISKNNYEQIKNGKELLKSKKNGNKEFVQLTIRYKKKRFLI